MAIFPFFPLFLFFFDPWPHFRVSGIRWRAS
jgi:hypothetical protein